MTSQLGPNVRVWPTGRTEVRATSAPTRPTAAPARPRIRVLASMSSTPAVASAVVAAAAPAQSVVTPVLSRWLRPAPCSRAAVSGTSAT